MRVSGRLPGAVEKGAYTPFVDPANPEPEIALPPSLRTVPTQARARQTVALILDTAARMLEEDGLEAFNTNRLAERAGVRVRTVYRYFPDKAAVIVALFERVVAEFDREALARLDRVGRDPDVDSRAGLETATRGLLDSIRLAPTHAAIRRAMRAMPELHALDQEDNARIADAYARGLRRIEPSLGPARARRIARNLVESATSVLDVAIASEPAEARGLVDELFAMQRAYLETLLP